MAERTPKCSIKYCRDAPVTKFPVGHTDAIGVCQHHFQLLNYVNANVLSTAVAGVPETAATWPLDKGN